MNPQTMTPTATPAADDVTPPTSPAYQHNILHICLSFPSTFTSQIKFHWLKLQSMSAFRGQRLSPRPPTKPFQFYFSPMKDAYETMSWRELLIIVLVMPNLSRAPGLPPAIHPALLFSVRNRQKYSQATFCRTLYSAYLKWWSYCRTWHAQCIPVDCLRSMLLWTVSLTLRCV